MCSLKFSTHRPIPHIDPSSSPHHVVHPSLASQMYCPLIVPDNIAVIERISFEQL